MINNIPFFDSFNPDEKLEFAALSNQVIEYSEKTAIVMEGQTDIAVFLLLKGEAVVTRNDLPKVTINTLTIFWSKSKAKVLKLDQKMFDKLKPETREKLKDKFIEVLVNRMSEMNTALVRLKVEMEAISQVAMDYEGEFDRILKSGKTMKEVFGGIHETISGLIR